MLVYVDATANRLESLLPPVDPQVAASADAAPAPVTRIPGYRPPPAAQYELRRFRTVETLLLTGNRLSSLPKFFEQNLTSLEHLDVSDNRLTAFVVSPTVRRLALANNPLVLPLDDPRHSSIVRLGADVKHATVLTSLDLSGVGLTELPNALCGLRQLVELNVARNAIDGPFNDRVFRLRNLAAFDFSHNAITSLDGFVRHGRC